MSLRFSIVIPVYNAEATIERCLDSLASIDFPSDRYEVVLVDNGSTDGTLDIMKRYPFRIVHETKKNSFSARNCGVRITSGEIIVFTDSDCIVSPEWLEAFDKSFGDDDIMACGGRIESFPPNNIVEEYPEYINAHDNHTSINNTLLFLPWIDTANAAYRRTVFETIGPFDDIHFTITGDVDMGWRTSIHGYRIAYCDQALVQHINRSTLRALMRQYYQYGYASIRILKKYRYYYEKTEGYHGYSGMWKLRSLLNIFQKVFRNLYANISIKGLKLSSIQICVEIAHLRGMIHETKKPREIAADQALLDAVAPKPLKSGYLVWGEDEEKFLYDFASENKMIVNDFGLFILEHLTKQSSIESIIEKASAEWNADRNLIEADVSEFIDSLQSTGLLTCL